MSLIFSFVSLLTFSQVRQSEELTNYFKNNIYFIESKEYHGKLEECIGEFEFNDNRLSYSYCKSTMDYEWRIYSDSYDIILQIESIKGKIVEKFQVKIIDNYGKKIIRLFKLTPTQNDFKREYYLEQNNDQ